MDADKRDEMLVRIDERTKATDTKIEAMKTANDREFKAIKSSNDKEFQELKNEFKNYVRTETFTPVQRLVFGMAGIILAGFAGGIVTLVMKGGA